MTQVAPGTWYMFMPAQNQVLIREQEMDGVRSLEQHLRGSEGSRLSRETELNLMHPQQGLSLPHRDVGGRDDSPKLGQSWASPELAFRCPCWPGIGGNL